ncbi:SAM-dependent methyltransferase [Oceaniglobus trochenteri]|uniref:SAM-dependent methyltransferase n=1 Tax=Oceaniglobus trochenteri TaxID=2763260 RepID=UPI001D000E50|nr:cyclopropane-fatty-acyl-phospholipid synthase family protein [Oceaniglobus trochenteri]
MWDSLFETFLKRMMRQGAIVVTLPSGREVVAGDGSPPLRVTLTDPTLVQRIVMTPDLGVGEGYMDGTLQIENDDLRRFLSLVIANSWNGSRSAWRNPLRHARRALRRIQQYAPAPKAQANVAHHYDLSGELYDLFLDADKQYSCAYFRTPDVSLEQAQADKKAHIAAKLLLEPGMRVLDIGCGWGGMALTLARDFGAQVVGVTLSREQHAIGRQRVEEAGLSEQVSIRLQDYREVRGSFDRIVSVGMFEHVGAPQYETYFRTVHDLLAPDGVALIHTIGRLGPPGITSPWVNKYIFPGGYVPALSEMSAAIEHQNLTITDVEVWRMHYAETLRHWEERFTANIDRARELYDDRFCRMWRFYLIASEMTFRHGPQVVFQAQLAHSKTAVPITRDYLYPQ